MAMWHCPHCGAPQAETARCWVCRRSSTTCSTCRHFRASLATDVGYCALDRRRRPLSGAELRGCWTERPAAGSAVAAHAGSSADSTGGPLVPEPDHRLRLRSRDFIPVELLVLEPSEPASAVAAEPSEPAPPFLRSEPSDGWAGRTSLFGEAER